MSSFLNSTDLPGVTQAFSSALLTDAHIRARTDSYFNRVKEILDRLGDCTVTNAFFIRTPVISAPIIMHAWLNSILTARD